jgi:hypothetical protein
MMNRSGTGQDVRVIQKDIVNEWVGRALGHLQVGAHKSNNGSNSNYQINISNSQVFIFVRKSNHPVGKFKVIIRSISRRNFVVICACGTVPVC